jgi:murein L,D-transpeptidase YcbB/YkuD
MHRLREGHRFGLRAGTALALILAIPVATHAEPAGRMTIDPVVPHAARMPAPSARIISVPAPNRTFAAPDATTRRRTPPPPATNAQYQRSQRQFREINATAQPAPAARPAVANPAPAVDAAPLRPAASANAAPAPAVPTAASPAAAAPAPAVTSAPVAAAPSIAVSDAEIAAKLRELIAGKQIERMVGRKDERDVIVAHYQKTKFAPLWITNGAANSRAQAAIAHLKTVDADGLEPTDYPVPNFAAGSADAIAEAEFKFTATLLTYARHALTGRVHFSRVSPNIDYKLAFDPAAVLQQVAAADNVTRTLASFNPQHPAYVALKAKLAEMRSQPREAGPQPIPNGPTLKYGRDRHGYEHVMSDPRVPALRARLGLPPGRDTRYDRSLADAVAKYQKSHGLKPDGIVASATLAALNGPNHEERLGAVLATMERWRWIPRDLGPIHVMLNIPDYHLHVMHNGEPVWTTRVVVGKPTQATPLLTETMKFITVNPTWNVPQSIIYNELLPIYETSDPAVFAKMGLRVERNNQGEVRVYQPPGERNALGRIRFNFPNKFLVYQHDTPEKYYFSHDRRAYSHGCMRVQDPLKYAEVLLSYAAPRGRYSQDSLRRMFGHEERQIDFQQQIPVHITYQTAFVDQAGKLQFRDDVYGLDAKLASLLKGSERAMADVVMERPADPNFKPTINDLRRIHSAATSPTPFALFEQLFR